MDTKMHNTIYEYNSLVMYFALYKVPACFDDDDADINGLDSAAVIVNEELTIYSAPLSNSGNPNCITISPASLFSTY